MSADAITISLDEIPVRLREDHDFRFLQHLGRVFCVFDEQDSGNIGFGVATDTEKLFVKYAGAKTICSHSDPADAIQRLKEAMPAYEALRHPHLVDLREHHATAEGYVAVFTWFAGECLNAHWAFAPDEKYHHPESPSYRYKSLPLVRRLDSLEAILAFHEHVAAKGYVAIDFYDGSILYDFSHHLTKVCDIDFYHPLPYTNLMGRLWGSTRFMSPEEFERGAVIDEVTNVFNLGATAFVLLCGERNRSFEAWDAGPALYEVACKAIQPDRTLRYPSIAAFRHAWNEARESLTPDKDAAQ